MQDTINLEQRLLSPILDVFCMGLDSNKQGRASHNREQQSLENVTILMSECVYSSSQIYLKITSWSSVPFHFSGS